MPATLELLAATSVVDVLALGALALRVRRLRRRAAKRDRELERVNARLAALQIVVSPETAAGPKLRLVKGDPRG